MLEYGHYNANHLPIEPQLLAKTAYEHRNA